MPKSREYGTIVAVYPASESSSMPPTPTTPRTPLLGEFRCPRCHGAMRRATRSGHCECELDEDDVELTEHERREYERGLVTWERAKDWHFWVRREWVPLYVLGGMVLAAVSFVAVYHREIIERLMPLVSEIREVPYGYLVPVAAITIFSFPPLFGSEIVMILSGVVWGVRGGFLIAAAGTILGEMACFTMFRTCCRGRAGRFSRQSLNYACLSRVVSRGGLWIAWVVRLSAIPTHVSTVIFAVCGLDYLRFLAALILALPKQFIAVYVGVMVTSNPGRDDIVLSNVVLGASILITLLALWYIHRQMLRVRKRVFLEVREELLRHGIEEPFPPSEDGDSDYLVWTGSEFRRRA